MSLSNLSNAELLDEAARIRRESEGRAILDARESEILRLSQAVENDRRATGILGIVEKFTGSILGEKRQAEARLAELRAREARVEQLLAERAGLEVRLTKAKSTFDRTKGLEAGYKAAASPEGIKSIFQKRAWALGELNFSGHLAQAAAEATATKMLGENFGVFVEAAQAEVDSIKGRLAEIERELKSIAK